MFVQGFCLLRLRVNELLTALSQLQQNLGNKH